MALKKYVKQFFNVIYLHNIQPHFMLGGEVFESPTKFSKNQAWQDLNF